MGPSTLVASRALASTRSDFESLEELEFELESEPFDSFAPSERRCRAFFFLP